MILKDCEHRILREAIFQGEALEAQRLVEGERSIRGSGVRIDLGSSGEKRLTAPGDQDQQNHSGEQTAQARILHRHGVDPCEQKNFEILPLYNKCRWPDFITFATGQEACIIYYVSNSSASGKKPCPMKKPSVSCSWTIMLLFAVV